MKKFFRTLILFGITALILFLVWPLKEKKEEVFDKKLPADGQQIQTTERIAKENVLDKEHTSAVGAEAQERLEQLEEAAKKELLDCDIYWENVKQEWEKAKSEMNGIDRRNPPKLLARNLIDLIRNRQRCSYKETNLFFTKGREKVKKLMLDDNLEEATELSNHINEYSNSFLKYDTFRTILSGLSNPTFDKELKKEITGVVLDHLDKTSQRPITMMELITSISLLRQLQEPAVWPKNIEAQINQLALTTTNFKDKIVADQEEFMKSQGYNSDSAEDPRFWDDPQNRASAVRMYLFEMDETERLRSRMLRDILSNLHDLKSNSAVQ